MGRATKVWHHRRFPAEMERPMPKPKDLSKSLVALDEDSTLIAVVEMSQSSWLVAGRLPGVGRDPLKKLSADADKLLSLLNRWRDEAEKAGHRIDRLCVAYEAGRDGFWLARWLRTRGIEAYVIHSNSIPVKRDHRRAKTDRLDTRLLMRSFLGWLRGESDHCNMVAIPTLEEEDAKRPHRERETLVSARSRVVNRMKATLVLFGIRGFNPKLRKAPERLEHLRTPEGMALPPNTLAALRRDMDQLRFLNEQIKAIETEREERLAQAPRTANNAMILMLARILGVGLESSELLVTELLSRDLRDRRAVARYAGLTGSPDESGGRRREKGLARAGNARVRRCMIQLAWRFVMFQKDCALVKWFRERTAGGRGDVRKTMIIALARKLLIALWRYVTQGELPDGVILKPAA